jgi:hypothetical protein
MDLLIVLDSNKAIVKLADEETAEFSDKIKYYEEKRFKTLLRRVSSINPIKTNEKIESSLESEIREKEEDKKLFVEIRLFPNLDQDEYNGALKSIKEYLKTKEEELVSETIEEKRAKIRARVHLSSIRELTEGVEPISMVDKVPRFHICFSQPRHIRSDLNDFHPQIKEDSPTICIIDSGVVREHPLLQGVIDEVIDFTEMGGNGYDNDGHGTFVAGLAAYGDSFQGEIHHPDMRVAIAKVMNKDGEQIDLETILPRVVERFHNKTRIFNMTLSKNVCCRPLDTELASKIDELERKYNVLFCIPTGNIRLNTIEEFINNGEQYPLYLERPESLLLQPGEACNMITVGSIARKESKTSLAGQNAPSPFTRRGHTPEDRIKPDFVEFDGNVAHIRRPNGVHVYEDENISTVSLNSNFENSYLTTENGTSFSTPLISRYAAKIIQKFPRASPNLIKALLINSTAYDGLSRRDKRILGHGKPILENALHSTPYRVTYYLESSINMRDEKIIKFRVPKEMGNIRGMKRIYVVLVYDPPVDSSKEYYILTGLDFKLHKGGTMERLFQGQSLSNWVWDNRHNKWDNVKVAIYDWRRSGWGEDWSIHIIPHYPRALEYQEYDQPFALVITLEDIAKKTDIHAAVMNELGITVREIERIRVR